MPTQLDVLLTADETPASLAAARGLDAAGYRVHIAATSDSPYLRRSRAVASFDSLEAVAADPSAFADELARVVARTGATLVLPGTEATLRALTGQERHFPAGVAVGTCPRAALDAATDKAAFQDLAANAGLETIPAIEIDPGSVDERASEIPFPAVAKPLRSVDVEADGRLSTVKARRVESVEQLRRLVSARPDSRWLVQRSVHGTLAAICGVAWQGELVCATHQLSPRIWPPDRGITAFGVTVSPDEPRERGVARLMGALEWSGVFGVQFLVGDGHAFAIDLNPRIYGSIGLAIAAGHNLPAIWADLLAGRPPRVGTYRVGVGYRVVKDDVRALAAALARGRRDALGGLLPRPHTAHAVFSWRDPWPASMLPKRAWTRIATRAGA